MDFINDYREATRRIPERILYSWKEYYEYLEPALNPEGNKTGVEITLYSFETVGLIINGFQRIRKNNMEEFNRAMDAFVLGVKIARGEATNSDYL